MRLVAVNAAALGDAVRDLVAPLAPDILALTAASPARACAVAESRGLRVVSQNWGDADEGLAIAWNPKLQIASVDRCEFDASAERSGALRLTLVVEGRHMHVFCARLSDDLGRVAAQQARLATLIEASRGPVVIACEGVVARAGVRWSRCADAWTSAQMRFVSVPPAVELTRVVQSAFGVVGAALPASAAASFPRWFCSDEFVIFAARSCAGAAAPDRPARVADVALAATASEPHIAIAL